MLTKIIEHDHTGVNFNLSNIMPVVLVFTYSFFKNCTMGTATVTLLHTCSAALPRGIALNSCGCQCGHW